MSGSCTSCGRPVLPVDVTRDVLELAAVVLAAGPRDEYGHHLALLMRTPSDSLQALAAVLLSVARPEALANVRLMALLHQLRDVEAVR